MVEWRQAGKEIRRTQARYLQSYKVSQPSAPRGGCKMGHGGALVEAITLNQRVVGSTPALAAM